MILKKLEEHKVMRDPIHGYIHIDYAVIWQCIDTKEFQRLRRIHQLGGNFQVYPTAEHSRFSHSLGVYEIVRRMVNEVKSLKAELSEYEKVSVMLAGLLHDVGHGPFSHAFEHVTNFNHEAYTAKIILENSEINTILNNVSDKLAQDVVAIIQHNHPNDLLNQIVSAQLDADRMDYLLRDSYFSATSYGQFDLERILRTLRVRKVNNQKVLVTKYTGIHSVEDYIMARYQMYWQVYFHPVARSYETIFIKLFQRLKTLYNTKQYYFNDMQVLIPFLNDGVATIEEHYRLDEYSLMYCCMLMLEKDDLIAKDLASRLINRKLFAYQLANNHDLAIITQGLIKNGFDPQYYLRVESVKTNPYSPYKGQKILVENMQGEIVELEKASTIVAAITKGEMKQEGTIFFPNDKE